MKELDVLKEESGRNQSFQAENWSDQQIATQQIENADPREKKMKALIMRNYFKLDALFANLHGSVYLNYFVRCTAQFWCKFRCSNTVFHTLILSPANEISFAMTLFRY